MTSFCQLLLYMLYPVFNRTVWGWSNLVSGCGHEGKPGWDAPKDSAWISSEQTVRQNSFQQAKSLLYVHCECCHDLQVFVSVVFDVPKSAASTLMAPFKRRWWAWCFTLFLLLEKWYAYFRIESIWNLKHHLCWKRPLRSLIPSQ